MAVTTWNSVYLLTFTLVVLYQPSKIPQNLLVLSLNLKPPASLHRRPTHLTFASLINGFHQTIRQQSTKMDNIYRKMMLRLPNIIKFNKGTGEMFANCLSAMQKLHKLQNLTKAQV